MGAGTIDVRQVPNVVPTGALFYNNLGCFVRTSDVSDLSDCHLKPHAFMLVTLSFKRPA
jgi:hypothetical protein